MSLVLIVSPDVRGQVGPANLAAFTDALPHHVQCWGCGEFIDTTTSGEVCLSIVAVRTISLTTFSHPRCGPSRLFTAEQYAEVGAQLGERAHAVSPSGLHEALYVDGEQR